MVHSICTQSTNRNSLTFLGKGGFLPPSPEAEEAWRLTALEGFRSGTAIKTAVTFGAQ